VPQIPIAASRLKVVHHTVKELNLAMVKKISPQAILSLEEALAVIFLEKGRFTRLY